MSAPASYPAEYVDVAFVAGRPWLGNAELHVAVDLAEPFGEDELRAAAARTERAFPLLGARIEMGWWRARWIAVEGAPSVEDRRVSGTVAEATAARVREPWDPARERAWRIVQLRADDGCRLVISVMHSVADAAGALGAARELGASLADPDAVPADSPARVDRGLGQIMRSVRLAQLPALLRVAIRPALLPLRYLRLAHPEVPWPADPAADGEPTFHTLVLDVDEGSPLRARLRRLGCTINDAAVALMAMLGRTLSGPGRIGNFYTVDMRPLLRDPRTRVANLSGVDMVDLARDEVGSFDETAARVARQASALPQQLTALASMSLNHLPMMLLPHALAHAGIRLWMRFAASLLNRGLTVTNIGALDPYLAPFGARATGASLIGPFLRGIGPPVVTATGFRGRLTLQINGFDGPLAGSLARVADGLAGRVEGLDDGP